MIVAGFAAVTVAEWMLGTVLAVHAYSVGGALLVGLVGFRFAPAAIAGLWTTQLSDHPHRHRTLALSAGARTGVVCLAAAALALGLPFGIVIGLVWLDAAAGTPYRPTQAALLPELVRTPGELTAAASLISNVKTSGQLVGALIGGVLVAQFPITVAVTAAAGLYAVAVAAALLGESAARTPGAWDLRTWGRCGWTDCGPESTTCVVTPRPTRSRCTRAVGRWCGGCGSRWSWWPRCGYGESAAPGWAA